MLSDPYVLVIVGLLPLTATMVVTQTNPYHALVMRGILGAVAALVYALFGAADVALTEALVGTMLSITLYAIAVRSSMRLRLGVLADDSTAADSSYQQLATPVQNALRQHYLWLERVPYPTLEALQTALKSAEIHATCWRSHPDSPYYLEIRVPRLYELLARAVPPEVAQVSVVPGAAAHSSPDSTDLPLLDSEV